MDSYSTNELHRMNYNSKYGSNWIIKDDKLTNQNQKNEFKLYATGDATISSGRIFIALPSDTIIDAKIKQKYNLI